MNLAHTGKENTDPESGMSKRIGDHLRSSSSDSDGGKKPKHGPGGIDKSKQGIPKLPEADDFTLLKPISRGAFGKVFLGCKKKDRNKVYYAIKVMKKSDLINKNLIAQVTTERDALAMIHSPFVVQIYYSLQSKHHIYLVMEYLAGGDVKSLLAACGYLDENVAAMYIAEVTLALEYLHHKGIIHRDLKPDNMLIARNGHVKLTDFGLSKVSLEVAVNTTPLAANQTTPLSRLDEYRTPGQILSLRCSLDFSAPQSQSSGQMASSCDVKTRRLMLPSPGPDASASSDSTLLNATDSTQTTAISGVSSIGASSQAVPHKTVTASAIQRAANPASATPTLMKSLTPTMQDSLLWKRSFSLESNEDASLDPQPPPSTYPFHSYLSHIQGNKPFLDSSTSSTDDVFSSTHHDLKDLSTITQTPERQDEGKVESGGPTRTWSRQDSRMDDTPNRRRSARFPSTSISACNLSSLWKAYDEDNDASMQETEYNPSTSRQTENQLESGQEEGQSQASTQSGRRKRGYEDVEESVKHSGLTQDVQVLQMTEMRKPSNLSPAGCNLSQLNASMDFEHQASDSESRLAPHKVRIRSQSTDSSDTERGSPGRTSGSGRQGTVDMGVAPLPGSNLSGIFALSAVSSPETEGEDPSVSGVAGRDTKEKVSQSFSVPLSAAQDIAGSVEMCVPTGEDLRASEHCRSSGWPDERTGRGVDRSGAGELQGQRESVAQQVGTGNFAMSCPPLPAVKTSHKQPKTRYVDFKEEKVYHSQTVRILRVTEIRQAHEVLHSAGDISDFCSSKTPERQANSQVASTHSDFVTPQRQPPSMSQPLKTPKEGVRRGPEPNLEEERILGTPDYLAPEILLQEKHGPAVDWWALGVCLFEFVTGLPPFNDSTPELVFNNILARAISWPTDMEEMGQEAQEAINALLTMEPSKRAAAPEVKSMALFSKLDWNRLLETEPPFIPMPDDIMDTSYFDPKNVMQQLTISAVDM